MEPFERYRNRLRSMRSRQDLVDDHADSNRDLVSGYYLTAEELLDLAWQVAGATMAALGIDRDEIPAYGNLVAPTVYDLVRERGITVPKDYRR
jgi:hypothetical protein